MGYPLIPLRFGDLFERMDPITANLSEIFVGCTKWREPGGTLGHHKHGRTLALRNATGVRVLMTGESFRHLSC